jgi:hypothetical protein
MSATLIFGFIVASISLSNGLEFHAGHKAIHSTQLKRSSTASYMRHPQHRFGPAAGHMAVEIGVHQVNSTITTLLEDFVSEYTGTIGVGTAKNGGPQFQARVVFDTGSTNLWVASVLCKTAPCDTDKARKFYNPSLSLTQEPWRVNGTTVNGKEIDITFGTGELKGPIHVDTYRVGPLEVRQQPFAMIREMDGSVFRSFPFEGILGLAFPSLSFGGILPFFDRVIQQKLLANNEFAFYLNADTEKPSALLWGGVDDNLYTGKIVMFRVVVPHYWAIELVDFKLGETSLLKEMEDDQRPKYVLIDSGTTFFTAGSGLYGSIMQRLRTAPCADVNDYPPITYVLRSADKELYELKVDQDVYMIGEDESDCKASFMKLDVSRKWGPAMILGEVFMRHWLTVFSRGSGDVKDAKVGFAKAKLGANPRSPDATTQRVSMNQFIRKHDSI